jgi:hypothetical protein
VKRQTALAVALAGLLALAGCTGSTTTAPAGDGGTAEATGTVQFYVSDQPTAISEFEHLNVTITRIGFERAGNDNETDATATAANGTATDATATEADDDDEDGEAEDERDAGWVTVETNRTVDLTRLKGDNATLVGQPETPAGNYTKVFVTVSDINATPTDGSSARVKLPSGRLQLTEGFALEPNGTVQFVYDISVVKAGNSGKYILKPVISESGADQPIREVDADTGDRDGNETDGDDSDGAANDGDRGQGNA